ncbi:expressed unknown protein [Seminavis robusta]|uniref:Uncharacterized protein n=1 Tax=Seminavis robusta TaxID=568900 RepID=A0A9N8D921_9STRA|nr:expressed unknown protein [Seminavis robusta]|eukprot:Sro5_g004010.1 n/a (282) ;mRNA; r:26535-27380
MSSTLGGLRPSIQWRAGDIAKCITIVLSLAFFACIVEHEKGRMHLFSESYIDAGFCIGNRELSWTVQSHAISFYADAAMAMLMVGLVYWGHQRRGMRWEALSPMFKNALTLLGHGCGHLFLAINTQRDDAAAKAFERLGPRGKVAAFVALLPVWYGFMSDSKRSRAKTLVFAVFHNALQVYVVPTRFFFTHVLMGVLLNSAFRKLAMPPHQKDLYYDLEACLVDIPILLAAFGEALFCDNYLIHWGGHVWFDMVVPAKFMVYFAIVLCRSDSYERAHEKSK